MIGITIGINAVYVALAELSARCFREMTGLDCIILSKDQLEKKGTLHPAALKLQCFDFVTDNDVVFFDADWFCVQNWDLTRFKNSPSIIACNDFILHQDWPGQYLQSGEKTYFYPGINNAIAMDSHNLRGDYIEEIKAFASGSFSYSKWINTGFWIANKNHHDDWLTCSLKLYCAFPGHHPQYYEQPAMNLALEVLGKNVTYIDRKYNTLVATRSQWPACLTGLHVKVKHNQNFVDLILNKQIHSPEHVKEYFFYENECN